MKRGFKLLDVLTSTPHGIANNAWGDHDGVLQGRARPDPRDLAAGETARVSGERGFTLIELTVAVTLFTIGVLGMLSVTSGITRLLGMGDRIATAGFYAQERLETARSTPCAALTSGSETRGGIYALAWGVAPMFGGNAQRVEVVVTYPSLPGVTRVDTLSTTISCVL